MITYSKVCLSLQNIYVITLITIGKAEKKETSINTLFEIVCIIQRKNLRTLTLTGTKTWNTLSLSPIGLNNIKAFLARDKSICIMRILHIETLIDISDKKIFYAAVGPF